MERDSLGVKLLDDNKYRIARQIITESIPAPGVIMDIAHKDDDSLSVIVYGDNLSTFEAGVRKNILLSLLNAAVTCSEAGIPVYIKRLPKA